MAADLPNRPLMFMMRDLQLLPFLGRSRDLLSFEAMRDGEELGLDDIELGSEAMVAGRLAGRVPRGLLWAVGRGASGVENTSSASAEKLFDVGNEYSY